MGPRKLVDESLKIVSGHFPRLVLDLGGVDPAGRPVYLHDVTINIPEHTFDRVIMVGHPAEARPWGVCAEFQLRPRPKILRDWFYKTAVITRQLQCEIHLLGFYLWPPKAGLLPDRYEVERGKLYTGFRFTALRLRDHVAQIENGSLRPLAVVLPLCQDHPGVETLEHARELILEGDYPLGVRRDLLAVSASIGAWVVGQAAARRVFRREMRLMRRVDFIQEWVDESAAQGEKRGEARGVRRTVQELLEERFGPLPTDVESRLEAASPEWWNGAVGRILRATSLRELGL
ncbi:MAG: hypothetical protein FJX77_10495 [Armatimonadetes bacterium]|nr:hypothetical protein [Armatimonadota bacterium]